MMGGIAYLGQDRSLSEVLDEAEDRGYGYEVAKKKKKGWSLRQRIHGEIKEKKKKQKEDYNTEQDTYKKKKNELPKKNVPVSALYKRGCKIELRTAMRYYKDEFELLKFDPDGEILGSEIKLKNRYEPWFLLLPYPTHKEIIFSIERTKITYITGEDIIEVVKEDPRYAKILKK